MRRIAALRSLSSDHHSGLVLARRARKASVAGLAVRTATWQDLRRRFRAELEPHFQIEERGLLPALCTVGEAALVDRTLAEHRSMRALIADDRPASLAAFADLLEAHIRFEEKELFETAQRTLAAETLAELGHIDCELRRAGCVANHDASP